MNDMDMDAAAAGSVGERLRTAREAQGLTLDDIASRTRIPIRHLQSIEREEWDALPAPTYSIGFGRAYANAVGLDGAAIGAEIRGQIGGPQPYPTTAAPYYQPADPARVPPRSLALIAAAIALVLAAGYMVWRAGAVDDGPEIVAIDEVPPPTAPVAINPAPAPAPQTGPVVLTATDDVWLRIYEAGGARLLERTLQAGERYEVPATATAPLILTGRPDALRVTVGTTEIPPLGAAQRTISDVSLLPADLLARVQPQPAQTPAP